MFFPSSYSNQFKDYFENNSPLGDVLKYQKLSWLYYMREWGDVAASPLNQASRWGKRYTDQLFTLPFVGDLGSRASAAFEMIERQTHHYTKPSFGITEALSMNGNLYQVEEEIVDRKPFCQLIHFKKTFVQGPNPQQEHFPKVLVVAPYSGHFATLLRDTCRSLLKDHDVYITDWANAQDVPVYYGLFRLDDYIDYLMDFIHGFDEDLHVLAVCQPAVPVLATVALMASANDPQQPKSMTLMGGPIDTRINPTAVNRAALEKPFSWFENNVIGRVPAPHAGFMRRVCPGFLMLTGFMSLNIDRHLKATKDLYQHLIQGDQESAEAHRKFYDEYRAVLDLPADYFLDSVRVAFQEHLLPRNKMTWRDEKVDLLAIEKTAILAVEGERDDISGVGQTLSALELCKNVPNDLKHYHLQKGVGHYGVFNGKRFREEIMPTIHRFIRQEGQGHGKMVKVLNKKS